MNKTAVLFSGGWDSLYCYLRALEAGDDPVLVFYDYGQSYLHDEQAAVQLMQSMLHEPILVRHYPVIPVENGIFDNRNLKFITDLESMGFQTVYFGSRNILPIFDKYGDSNWWWAKRLAYNLGITIKMPATLVPKPWIISYCKDRAPILSRYVFSTEGLS